MERGANIECRDNEGAKAVDHAARNCDARRYLEERENSWAYKFYKARQRFSEADGPKSETLSVGWLRLG